MWTKIHPIKIRHHYHNCPRFQRLTRKQRSSYRQRQFKRRSKSRRSKRSTSKAWRSSRLRRWGLWCMNDQPKFPSKSPWTAARSKWSNVMSREVLQASCNSRKTLLEHNSRCISNSRKDKTSAWMLAWWMILKRGTTWRTLRKTMRWLICKWWSKLAKQTPSNSSKIKERENKKTLPTLSTGFCPSRAILTTQEPRTNWSVVDSWAVEAGADRAKISLRC